MLAAITAASVAEGSVVANEVPFGRMDVTRDGECKVFREAVAGDRLLYIQYQASRTQQLASRNN